ncbi:ARL2 protein, partial [Erythrocercus mccallii]|nr:ARL2 protein [Erythrocercus mccallii]
GLDNAGKTTLLKRLNAPPVGGTSPTLGFNIKTLEPPPCLHVWDVGGQSSLRSYPPNYFESTDGLVWVVDSSDPPRLRLCARELRALLREERLAGATLLVFANKQDPPPALPAGDIREALELAPPRSHRWRIQGCSAFTGRAPPPGLDWLLDDIGGRL